MVPSVLSGRNKTLRSIREAGPDSVSARLLHRV